MPSFRGPFAAGDVVWAPDAYHGDDPQLVVGATRPWLVISNDSFPGQGSQYLCCALTSGSSTGSSFILVDAATDWESGGTPKRSAIDTETIMTVKRRWIVSFTGRLSYARLADARKRVKTYF